LNWSYQAPRVIRVINFAARCWHYLFYYPFIRWPGILMLPAFFARHR
jgi:hypothetical protein